MPGTEIPKLKPKTWAGEALPAGLPPCPLGSPARPQGRALIKPTCDRWGRRLREPAPRWPGCPSAAQGLCPPPRGQPHSWATEGGGSGCAPCPPRQDTGYPCPRVCLKDSPLCNFLSEDGGHQGTVTGWQGTVGSGGCLGRHSKQRESDQWQRDRKQGGWPPQFLCAAQPAMGTRCNRECWG